VKKFVLASGRETQRRRRLVLRPSPDPLEIRALLTASFEGLGASVFVDAVSPDGAVVVGSETAVGAVEWTKSAGVVQLLDATGNAIQGNATGVSENGSVIVGTFDGALSAPTGPAFRWTASGGATAIAALSSAQKSTANAVSEDGTIIAGDYGNGAFTAPYLLTSGGSPDVLPTENVSGLMTTEENTMSANGTVVAGTYVGTSADPGGSPYAWVANQFIPLTDDGAFSGSANAISADGSVVVGERNFSGTTLAFRWDPAAGSGATDLTMPAGFTDSTAAGVSRPLSAGWHPAAY
jgi:uncharacterized membrane protein